MRLLAVEACVSIASLLQTEDVEQLVRSQHFYCPVSINVFYSIVWWQISTNLTITHKGDADPEAVR